MTIDYDEHFHQKLRKRPPRQMLRVAQFQLRQWMHQHFRTRNIDSESTHPVSTRLQPPPHRYQGHSGPWIEDYFCNYWSRQDRRVEQDALIYLPIFWTDLYLHSQTHLYTPFQYASWRREVDRHLEIIRKSDARYFTILEYDHPIWDWHAFPRNVLVFSAGGWGDVAIPLLKGSPAYKNPVKDIPLSFVGRLDGASDATGLRSTMHHALADHALFTAGQQWREIMGRSVFSLCPRGLGRASFRLYEAMSVGSIPVYVWDDREWLPYQDELQWSTFSISLHISRIHELPALLNALSETEISCMQQNIEKIYSTHFTLEGCSNRIRDRVHQLHQIEAFRELIEQREYPL